MHRRPLLVWATVALASIVTSRATEAAAPADPENNPAIVEMLHEARRLIDAKEPAAAIRKCDGVIAAYKAKYGNEKQKIYCAHTPAALLGYLTKAAVDKRNAIGLSGTWADAHFMKAYALVELGRRADAKASLQSALALSPWNSQYLSELGTIYNMEKNWSKALQQFKEAEDNAPLLPDDTKAQELNRARRGLGYVYVELGKLEEAEKKYEQCLASDPNDRRARAELDYVRELKAKKAR